MFDKKIKLPWGTPPKQPLYKKRSVLGSAIGAMGTIAAVVAVKQRGRR